MLVWENKKRDKRNETSPDIQDSEFMNLTDRQNRGFRVTVSFQIYYADCMPTQDSTLCRELLEESYLRMLGAVHYLCLRVLGQLLNKC